MKEIEIQKTVTKGFGFTGKTTYHSLPGVKFENGKIAYLDTDKSIKVLNDASDLEDIPELEIVEKE